MLLRPSATAEAGSRHPSGTVFSFTGTALVRSTFVMLAAATDAVAITAASLVSAAAYHLAVHGSLQPIETDILPGLLMAVLFFVPNITRNEYAITKFMTPKGQVRRSAPVWGTCVFALLGLGFATKTTGEFSRGAILAFALLGYPALLGARMGLVCFVRSLTRSGRVVARRIFLVGDESAVRAFTARYQPGRLGMTVAGAGLLGQATLAADLERAARAARQAAPDDIFILVPWSNTATIEATVEAFLGVPCALHLGPEQVLDRFTDAHIVRSGPIASLSLVRAPLTTFEVVTKRAIDTVVAGLALVLLAPVFAAVALAIKLDSAGPVFFTQRRYGFNQQPFRIFKFRSMTTMEDGAVVTQASRGDARITRVGRVLRRTNLDEIPQILNVLLGDMALVGPRPHAMAHDERFERDIALYARRHNVRPGISGWAQVNGHRGETDTTDKMRARIAHDLFYIDNWSFWMDVKIMVLTLVSSKAFRNAF